MLIAVVVGLLQAKQIQAVIGHLLSEFVSVWDDLYMVG